MKPLLFLPLLWLTALSACGPATTIPPTRPVPSPTAAPPTQPAPSPTPPAWKLIWSDEFAGPAGTAPNPANWNYDIGGNGWGNKEWEFYTMNTENAGLDGAGNLVISAKKEDLAATTLRCAYGPAADGRQPCAASSARLLTKDRFAFTYGRVEARIKIPAGQGIWPAFWMLGSDIAQSSWPGCGEIDILENIGKPSEQFSAHGTLHGPGYSGAAGLSKTYLAPVRLADDFHTYAVEWEAAEIRWYFDDVQYFSLTPASLPAGKEWVFNKPFFLIMNVAVGGGWPGAPDDTTVFPQHMLVDYVRVYQRP